MYQNWKALEELERLDKISLNKNPSGWEKEDQGALKLSSLNCQIIEETSTRHDF